MNEQPRVGWAVIHRASEYVEFECLGLFRTSDEATGFAIEQAERFEAASRDEIPNFQRHMFIVEIELAFR